MNAVEPVSIVGLGLSKQDLTPDLLILIDSADILIGGARHLAYFPDIRARKHPIAKNLSDTTDFIRSRMDRNSIVVLASGDPLFFGIGNFLIRALGAEKVRIFPNITSVSAAFSRIKTSWNDACVLSLHGRSDPAPLDIALERKDKIAILTDTRFSPAWLGKFLVDTERTHFDMCVLERIGSPDERVRWVAPDQAAVFSFSDPNLVILLRQRTRTPSPPNHPGMPDEQFFHDKGMITKSEVRVVTLSKLRLFRPDLTLWDLGAGAGSVSIEASFFLPEGRIYAVEKEASRISQLEANKKKFRVRNMEIVHAELPEALSDLPRPDRVFIGGGGKRLPRIIGRAVNRLTPGGVIVINTVLIPSIHRAMTTLRAFGIAPDIVQLNVSHGSPMPWGVRLQAQNPVWIISGVIPSEEVS